MAFGDFTVTRASTKLRIGSNGLYGSVANNVPAFEFNTDGTYRGLLVEPGATNQIRNNSATGAVVGVLGSGGSLPTNYNIAVGGLTREVLGTGTDNGITYFDLKVSGTATSTGSLDISYELQSQIVATGAQVWTSSVFLRVISATLPPTSYQINVREFQADGTTFVANTTATVVPTTTIGRFSQTITTNALTGRVQPRLFMNITNGASYDFTIRIGWPQMELGSVATSPIVTTAGTASRVADVVSLTGASSLIGATEGTIYAEVVPRNYTAGVNRRILNIRVDGNNVISLDAETTIRRYSFSATNGGVQQVGIISGDIMTDTIKLSGAYKVDDFAFYINGSQIGTDTSGTVPNVTTGTIGLGIRGDGSAGTEFNGWIRSVALFPTRLSNAQLVTLTT
jgi:hypothetical protein